MKDQFTLTGDKLAGGARRYRVRLGFCLAGHGDVVPGQEVPLRPFEARPHLAIGWLEPIVEPEPVDAPLEEPDTSEAAEGAEAPTAADTKPDPEPEARDAAPEADPAALSSGSPEPVHRDPKPTSTRKGGAR